ncbi:hypothetical protein BpHYR1_027885 [Brachionus plicatilis]|uniref:Uncharacterized protein n=1 Tax=Brachionus plicatilis TaxID=10195 RepID=A0A3M7REJ0_BRAPC|nr:hypothetical protein BpHYR1_027885 [Brachionus plicatilis]
MLTFLVLIKLLKKIYSKFSKSLIKYTINERHVNKIVDISWIRTKPIAISCCIMNLCKKFNKNKILNFMQTFSVENKYFTYLMQGLNDDLNFLSPKDQIPEKI